MYIYTYTLQVYIICITVYPNCVHFMNNRVFPDLTKLLEKSPMMVTRHDSEAGKNLGKMVAMKLP